MAFATNRQGTVATLDEVKSNPELASQGGAATYGMMAHIPLRGMVKQKVLEMYSELYRAGSDSADLGAADQDGRR